MTRCYKLPFKKNFCPAIIMKTLNNNIFAALTTQECLKSHPIYMKTFQIWHNCRLNSSIVIALPILNNKRN